jgi:hypothetical protein
MMLTETMINQYLPGETEKITKIISSRMQLRRNVMFATHFHLLPMLIMRGGLLPRLLYAFMAWFIGTKITVHVLYFI